MRIFMNLTENEIEWLGILIPLKKKASIENRICESWWTIKLQGHNSAMKIHNL